MRCSRERQSSTDHRRTRYVWYMLLWGDPLKGDLEAVRVDVGVEQEVGEGGHGFVGVERECHVRTLLQ